MKDKVYYLCVELNINGESKRVTIAKGNLLALEKYTLFCNGPLELLRTMPDKEEFSSKTFLEKYLLELNDKNDPFSIRTSEGTRSKALPLLYKKDEDIILTNKEEIVQNMRGSYKFTIDDVETDNIDEKTKVFLKELWNLFCDPKIMPDFHDYIEKKLDPDKRVSFDKRYEVILKNKWMILGLSKSILEKFIKYIYKDPRKRVEFLKFIKENYKELLPKIDSSERQIRLNLLENELRKKGISTSKVRKQINANLYELHRTLKTKAPEIKVAIVTKPYEITEKEIIEYNEKRRNLTPIMERILNLSKELENLKRELLVIKSVEIKEKIEARITQIEFEIYELENNKYCYTDNGELIKEDEMIK